MPSTLDWLRARDDAALAELLRARPDLTVPAPGDLTVLAWRLNTGPSVWRAMESLNQFHIQVLQALAVLGADRHGVARTDVADLLGSGVPPDALGAALDTLEGLALVRGSATIQMPSAVLAVLGPYPAGLGSPGGQTVAEAEAALAGIDPTARGILERLASGVPRGTTDSRSSIAAKVKSLIAAGLLRRVDPETVELPRAGTSRWVPCTSPRPRTRFATTAYAPSTAPAAARRWPPSTGSGSCSRRSGRTRRRP
jgi:hypothetical protein